VLFWTPLTCIEWTKTIETSILPKYLLMCSAEQKNNNAGLKRHQNE